MDLNGYVKAEDSEKCAQKSKKEVRKHLGLWGEVLSQGDRWYPWKGC